LSESILVTGNRGFIGSHLYKRLSCVGIDLKDGQDIRTYKANRKYDVIVHTAALTSVVKSMEDPKSYYDTNVWGTYNMVQQHPEAHFVYLSTAGVYGEGAEHTVNSDIRPGSVYALTKHLGELAVQHFAKSYIILRLTNVIGPGVKGEPNVYQVFREAEKLPIYGDGKQTRDFIHVDKVCDVIYRACARVFNVGSGVRKTVLEVAEEFNKPIEFHPERKGEIRHFGVADAIHIDS